MGTKNAPGKFDCYKNAKPNEPMFVLLARDIHAPGLVLRWALERRLAGDMEKAREAEECAAAMLVWRKQMMPEK